MTFWIASMIGATSAAARDGASVWIFCQWGSPAAYWSRIVLAVPVAPGAGVAMTGMGVLRSAQNWATALSVMLVTGLPPEEPAEVLALLHPVTTAARTTRAHHRRMAPAWHFASAAGLGWENCAKYAALRRVVRVGLRVA